MTEMKILNCEKNGYNSTFAIGGANIIIAAVFIPYTLFNLAGEAWMHMVFGAVVEVGLLCLIIHYAWKWPRIET